MCVCSRLYFYVRLILCVCDFSPTRISEFSGMFEQPIGWALFLFLSNSASSWPLNSPSAWCNWKYISALLFAFARAKSRNSLSLVHLLWDRLIGQDDPVETKWDLHIDSVRPRSLNECAMRGPAMRGSVTERDRHLLYRYTYFPNFSLFMLMLAKVWHTHILYIHCIICIIHIVHCKLMSYIRRSVYTEVLTPCVCGFMHTA